MALKEVIDRFSAAGGIFITPVEELAKKLEQCRGVVFDWDGVFNSGRKGRETSSGFAEADSMGTNMLRYGLWRRLEELPYTAIISGENNESAIAFARREHFTSVYTGIRRKQDVVAHLCETVGIKPNDIACVFDDINDLAMAEACGLRFMVRREASPMFSDFTIRRKMCDYVTGADSSSYAVREVCEMLLGIIGSYGDVVESRVASDENYEKFFKTRQSIRTSCYILQDEEISKS